MNSRQKAVVGRAKTGEVMAAALPPLAFFGAYAAPRLRSWGTTADELARVWPGDELVPDPGFVWTNAVTIARPASEVWPWLAQLGQARGGLYSYDWLENAVGCGVRSVNEVKPELQGRLAVGDRVIRMARYAPYNPVARYDPGHALVLGGVKDSDSQLQRGRPSSTWAFIVEPTDRDSSRLVVRSRGRGLIARLQGPAQFVMQRKLMLGIKQRAERTGPRRMTDVLVPLSWLTGAGVTGAHAVRALQGGPHRSRSAALAGLSGIGAEILLFGDPPGSARAVLVGGLLATVSLDRSSR
jgi:hypothetical protein